MMAPAAQGVMGGYAQHAGAGSISSIGLGGMGMGGGYPQPGMGGGYPQQPGMGMGGGYPPQMQQRPPAAAGYGGMGMPQQPSMMMGGGMGGMGMPMGMPMGGGMQAQQPRPAAAAPAPASNDPFGAFGF